MIIYSNQKSPIVSKQEKVKFIEFIFRNWKKKVILSIHYYPPSISADLHDVPFPCSSICIIKDPA
jgi:hypothetical protein